MEYILVEIYKELAIMNSLTEFKIRQGLGGDSVGRQMHSTLNEIMKHTHPTDCDCFLCKK